MDESGIRECLPHFVYALAKAGAAHSTISRFRAYWNALPISASNLPCPLCFAKGRQGSLQAATIEDVITSVRCDRCKEEIVIDRRH